MTEILTDELLEQLGTYYENYCKILGQHDIEPLINFYQYVEKHLQFRAWQLRKGDKHVEL